jgi:outer membrane murein-binding lipoprotein Lpp
MKKPGTKIITMALTALAVCGLLLAAGCEGSQAKKDITQTVEQAVGAETAKKGQQVKQEAGQIMQQEMERAKQDINAGTEDNHGAVPNESPEME